MANGNKIKIAGKSYYEKKPKTKKGTTRKKKVAMGSGDLPKHDRGHGREVVSKQYTSVAPTRAKGLTTGHGTSKGYKRVVVGSKKEAKSTMKAATGTQGSGTKVSKKMKKTIQPVYTKTNTAPKGYERRRKK